MVETCSQCFMYVILHFLYCSVLGCLQSHHLLFKQHTSNSTKCGMKVNWKYNNMNRLSHLIQLIRTLVSFSLKLEPLFQVALVLKRKLSKSNGRTATPLSFTVWQE